MKAIDHAAHTEEQAHVDDTVSKLETARDALLQRNSADTYWGPPDTYRIFRNKEIERANKCAEALRHLYFGRVDWRVADAEATERFYIGLTEFSPYIIAWQDTLAADLYYNRETTRENGDLVLVRTLKIQDRQLLEIEDNFLDPSVTGELDPDSLLAKILEESRGLLQDIVATINRQQYNIIRAPLSAPIIVQGAPGSGKTVIALHRVSYLLYNNRDLRSQNVLILGPNPVFMQYVSQVLPSLGAQHIPQLTFDQWIFDQLGETLNYQPLEELLELWLDPERSSSEKLMHLRNCRNMGSLTMGELLRRYVSFLHDEVLEGKSTLVCRYRPSSATDVIAEERSLNQVQAVLDLEDVKKLPLNQQREAVELKLSNDIAAEIVRRIKPTPQARDEVSKRVNERVREQVHEYFGSWRALNVSVAYRRLFRQRSLLHRLGTGLFSPWDLELMGSDAPTATTPFRFSDLVGLLYFKLQLDGIGGSSYGHIIVDEAQDIPALFFEGLSRFIPKRSITILGDIGQGVFLNNGISSWQELYTIFPMEKQKIEELRVCYRSTWQIMQFANDVLKRAGVAESGLIQPLNRVGQPVSIHPCDTERERVAEIIRSIRAELNAGWKSIAVICKGARDCEVLGRLLHEAEFTDFQLIADRNQEYQAQVILIPTYLAKGLEFDAVILADGHNYPADDLTLKLLFVAITRAAHRLHICHQGQISPLLDENIPIVPVESYLGDRDAKPTLTVESYAQANRLELDWCVELISRSGWLPLLQDGRLDPIVMDLAVQASGAKPSSQEDTFIAPLEPAIEQKVKDQAKAWDEVGEEAVQVALTLSQTVFGLLRNHLRNLGLLPDQESDISLPQQLVLLTRLRKLITEAGLDLPAGRWTGMQRLQAEIDRSRAGYFDVVFEPLLDYGLLETQTTANQRQQCRIRSEWIEPLLEISVGLRPSGLDVDLLERLPKLPAALDLSELQEVGHAQP